MITWVPPKVSSSSITILTKEPWMCKYPDGTDENRMTTFCGKPRLDWSDDGNDEINSPYCAEHHRLCFQPAPKSTKPRPRPHYAK